MGTMCINFLPMIKKSSAYEATAKGPQDGKHKLTQSILSSMQKLKQTPSHPSVL